MKTAKQKYREFLASIPLPPEDGGIEDVIADVQTETQKRIVSLERENAELRKQLEEARKDASRLDYLEQCVFKLDPKHQFYKLERGPLLCQLTLTMYDGRTTFWRTRDTLRQAIDSAMQTSKEKG